VGATGVWAAKDKQIALYSSATGAYTYTLPIDGMSVVLAGTRTRLQYDGTVWSPSGLPTTGGSLTGALN
ncbi:DUF2793 domain-containing protein, partial [Stenotrophomonas maltophilia]|uniref:DUF2793 domain-containing protein n=1 Tax=Stenotrophomonas maltophilia TaxID=40324 RepID=UPI0013DB0CC1